MNSQNMPKIKVDTAFFLESKFPPLTASKVLYHELKKRKKKIFAPLANKYAMGYIRKESQNNYDMQIQRPFAPSKLRLLSPRDRNHDLFLLMKA